MDQLQRAIYSLIAFILCVSVHEFGHAFVANRLGDPTPRAQGRLTLSPLHHIDPLGTIVIPLIAALGVTSLPLIAWGRPVQTNPMAYTRRFSRGTGHMLVALAGPAMNLVMAVLASVVLVMAAWLGAPRSLVSVLFVYFVQLNLVLMCFNLLPVPPLDGGAVLAWFLPRRAQPVVDVLQRWGLLILILLVLSPTLDLPFMDWAMAPLSLLTDLWGGALAWAIRL